MSGVVRSRRERKEACVLNDATGDDVREQRTCGANVDPIILGPDLSMEN